MSSISPTIFSASGRQTSGVDLIQAVQNEQAAPVENPNAVLDRDAFLKLLVAQLRYQDPSSPADTDQMLAQTAQLETVDRLNEIAKSLSTSLTSQQLSLAGTIVGREVTFADAEGLERTAIVETARIDGTEISLVAGGYDVPFASIKAIKAPSTIAAPAPAAGATPAAPAGTAATPTGTSTSADASTADSSTESATEPAAASPAGASS